MRKYSFLLSPTWILWFVMCCVAAVLCVVLAEWQMSRNDHLHLENQKIENNYDAPAYQGDQGLRLFEDYDDSQTWHPVDLTGQYEPQDTTLVRNRPQDGRVGYEVLVPFRTDQGQIVVVNRGWIPTGDSPDGMPGTVPQPPQGHVTASVRLRPDEGAVARSAPEGQIASIDLPQLAERWDLSSAPEGYGRLAQETPAPSEAPKKAPKPEIAYGPHLSYSLQWYAFAVLVFVAYGYSARQHLRNEEWDRAYVAEVERQLAKHYDENGNYVGDVDEELIIRQLQMADDMPAHLKSLQRLKRTRKSTGVSNEDEEDALLDALERHNHT